MFEKLHNQFKETNIPFVNINEDSKTMLPTIKREVHIVKPECCYLEGEENHWIKNTTHSTVQRYHVDKHDESLNLVVEFIRKRFKE